MEKLSHVDDEGCANMVDISEKRIQFRSACAEGFIHLQPETIRLVKENKMKKGDVISVAKIAGIQACKKTSELIPLCHPLQITKVDLKTEILEDRIRVISFVKCCGQTGIEMEALTAVSITLLTIYDMSKAVDKQMVIGNIKLIEKKKSDQEIN
ncbi:MAG: cyclic pyranopterin monophosphate synthase MoaC [Melioribacteraceae bacterium]|jgi:cyclic pyranopterin phosphate synthase|nr:cyclic pyranopterin monophosphate synthase MoaC [Melioribacteraceae bacterium]